MRERIKAIQNKLTSQADRFVFILLILQPILDAASYFANLYSVTAITTALRFIMLVAILLYCYTISDRKRAYYIMAGVLVGFWIIRAVVCFRDGYPGFISDTAYYLRTVHMPLLVLCFITCFKKGKNIPDRICKAFLVNFFVMLAFVGLSYLTGTQHYTYDHYKIGITGWAAVDNCQSAIVCLIVPLLIYYSYKKSKVLFAVCSVLCAAQMYFIATKLAYCSIILIFAGMIFTLIVNKEKRVYYYGVLTLIIALTLAGYRASPMIQVRNINDGNEEMRQGWADVTMRKSKEKLEEEVKQLQEGVVSSPEVLDKYRIYEDLYSMYLPDFIGKFGLERTVEAYGGTESVSQLIDMRVKKNMFAKMIWDESDTLTHLFGFEHTNMLYGENTYDLENDFNALLYYYGYVGIGMYIAFLAYFVLRILMMLLRNFKGTFTVENCTVGITFILILGAAQFSGNVLRRPNVSIFLSLILAYIFILTERNDRLSETGK